MLTTLPFDYQAELDQISKEVQTTLQAKFDVAIANFQKSIENIDIKVEQKIQHCMEKLHTTQADKATQENHTQQLEQLTIMLKMLVSQINTLLDKIIAQC